MKRKGTMNVPVTSFDNGMTVLVINHNTKEIQEFESFMLVGFVEEKGEFVANNCTLPELSKGLLRLHDRNDELKAEDAKTLAELKPKNLIILPTQDKR